MGAFDDLDASQPRSPSFAMIDRGVGAARRKVMLLVLLGGFLVISFVAFRRQDQIGDIIETQKHSWTNINSSYTELPLEKPGTPAAEHETDDEIIKNVKEEPKDDYKKAPAKSTKVHEEVDENPEDDRKKAPTKPSKVHEDAEDPDDGYRKASTKPPKVHDDAKKPLTEAHPVASGPRLGDRKLSDSSLVGVRNETLGFEQIYVLNMAGRTDKLDAMRLTASVTNFSFEVMEGVSGNDVPAKALSGVFEEGEGKAGVIGCWRGHMNFAHTILKNKHATALIMEDDADWDVDFRSQLELVALGSQTLLDTPKTEDPASPYGDGWDLIWLGHCASQPVDGDYRRVLMKNDPTVTPPNHRVNYGGVPDMTPYGNSTRLMYFSKGSTCTYAYALSYHGAQKVLKWLSMDIYNKPVDFGLHDMCQDEKRGFKCIGMFPQLIGDHKPAGGASKDSDIGANGDDKSKVRDKGFSYNVVYSTRLNVDALIDGKKENAKSQWPEDTPDLKGPVEMEIREDEVDDTPD